MPSIVALIPARANSKRIPGKNTKVLGGKPLIQWTIDVASASRVFSDIQLWTDDAALHQWNADHTSIHSYQRDPSADDERDIAWVQTAIGRAGGQDAFAILRPTSPFRTAQTIQRAWAEFQAKQPADSLRAVETVRQHPGKMWTVDTDGCLIPIMPYKHPDGTPWHSSPTQSLKTCYVQNSSLEIAWTKTVRETGTISGTKILPFFTQDDEGFSIDYPGDFDEAERRLAQRTVTT